LVFDESVSPKRAKLFEHLPHLQYTMHRDEGVVLILNQCLGRPCQCLRRVVTKPQDSSVQCELLFTNHSSALQWLSSRPCKTSAEFGLRKKAFVHVCIRPDQCTCICFFPTLRWRQGLLMNKSSCRRAHKGVHFLGCLISAELRPTMHIEALVVLNMPSWD
jgi:hypothetical protein